MRWGITWGGLALLLLACGSTERDAGSHSDDGSGGASAAANTTRPGNTSGGSGGTAAANGGSGGSGGSSGSSGSGASTDGGGASASTTANGGSGATTGSGGSAGAGGAAASTGGPLDWQVPLDDFSDIAITSLNGTVTVVTGTTDELEVHAEPFVRLPDTASPAEIEAQLELLKVEIVPLQTGRLMVDMSIDPDANPSLGCDLEVAIPESYDQAVTILQHNGTTEVRGIGQATDLSLQSDNGRCEVTTAHVRRFEITCDVGSLTALVPEPANLTSVSVLSAGLGDISLTLPSDQAYNAQLQGATVEIPDAEGCVIQSDSASSRTLSCAGATAADPVLRASANLSLSDLLVEFDNTAQ